MAFENATAVDMADLVSKLFTFATANGWTQHDLDTPNGEASLQNTGGRCFVSFRWNTTTPNNLGIYQALGFGPGMSTVSVSVAGLGYSVGDVLTVLTGARTTAATATVTSVGGSGDVSGVILTTSGINYTVNPSSPAATTVVPSGGTGCTLTVGMTGTDTVPGNHCDDSGQGYVTNVDTGNASLDRSRSLSNIGAGPYTYWIFSDVAPDYIHFIVESGGVYRHASFGLLDKQGDWLGGEYCCGMRHPFGNPSAGSASNCVALDGLWFSNVTQGTNPNNDTENVGPTIRMEGFIDQNAAGKWGLIFNNSGTGVTSPSQTLDRAGNARQRLLGGFKAGFIPSSLGYVASNASNGFVPMYAIAAYYWDISKAPVEVALLGFQPGIRGASIKGFSAGQEVTIGSDIWIIFPVSRKANNAATDDSQNLGLAYLKVP